MAGSGSYARGDHPRSVPDPDAAAYAAMVREQRDINAGQAAAVAAKAGARRDAAPAAEAWWQEHPGLGESLIPIWGSAREAVAEAYDGDIAGAALNSVMAASDLMPGAFAAKGLAKGGLKAGSHTWRATRKWMGKRGMLDHGQPGHHGIIPRGGWGEHIPDRFKNQPWNITATEGAVDHGRIHGPYKRQPQYGQLERYWRGTPAWARTAHGWIPNAARTAMDSDEDRRAGR